MYMYVIFMLLYVPSFMYMYAIKLQIAKDMERWAKGVNAAKATQKQQLKALIQLERAEVVARETVDQQLQQQQQLPVLSPDSAVTRSGISLSAALEVHVHVHAHVQYIQGECIVEGSERWYCIFSSLIARHC